MKRIMAIFVFLCLSTSSFSQMKYKDLSSYCRVMSEASTPTLLARSEGLPRSKAEELIKGMTDPAAIRMVREVIEFAYLRPTNMDIDTMRTELRNMCLARKIFVQ